MNIYKTFIIYPVVFCSAMLLIQCGETKKTDNSIKDVPVHSHEETAHVHDYTCPMHPEVAGHKGETCHKCGMALVHEDDAKRQSTHSIRFKSDPPSLVAGGAATLFFRPVHNSDTTLLVPLESVHEKKMHLIIVSRDLSYFEHVHPAYDGQSHNIKVLGRDQAISGSSGQQETRLNRAGEYLMFVDYKPAGGNESMDRIPLTVSGLAAKDIALGTQRLTWEKDGYQVTLAIGNSQIGKPATLKAAVSFKGSPVVDLDKYLGALAHMVIISDDTEHYLHVHPADSKKSGPEISFQTQFPQKGKYKVFMQFNHMGSIHTCDFVMQVQAQAGAKS